MTCAFLLLFHVQTVQYCTIFVTYKIESTCPVCLAWLRSLLVRALRCCVTKLWPALRISPRWTLFRTVHRRNCSPMLAVSATVLLFNIAENAYYPNVTMRATALPRRTSDGHYHPNLRKTSLIFPVSCRTAESSYHPTRTAENTPYHPVPQ